MFSENRELLISRLHSAYTKVQEIKRADFNDTQDEDLDGDFGFIYFLVNQYYENCIKNNNQPDEGLLQILDSYDSYMENRQRAPSSSMPSKYSALERGYYSRLESEISTGLVRVKGHLENLQDGQNLDDITIDAVIGNRPLDESKYGSLIEYVVLQKDLDLASKIFKCQKIDQNFHAKILEKLKNDTNFATSYKNMTNLPVPEFISHGQSLQLSMQVSQADHKRSAGIMTGLTVIFAACAVASAFTGVGLPGAIFFGILSIACGIVSGGIYSSSRKPTIVTPVRDSLEQISSSRIDTPVYSNN